MHFELSTFLVLGLDYEQTLSKPLKAHFFKFYKLVVRQTFLCKSEVIMNAFDPDEQLEKFGFFAHEIHNSVRGRRNTWVKGHSVSAHWLAMRRV